MAGQGNGADSAPKYTGTLPWQAPNGTGMKKLTISVINPHGGRDEKGITIEVK